MLVALKGSDMTPDGRCGAVIAAENWMRFMDDIAELRQIDLCGLTLEVTCGQQAAKRTVERQVERKVRFHRRALWLCRFRW